MYYTYVFYTLAAQYGYAHIRIIHMSSTHWLSYSPLIAECDSKEEF